MPAEWPEGAEVEIRRLDQLAPEDDGPMSAGEIARVLAAMDAMQPFEMSEEERASLEAERRARKEWDLAHFEERAERLRKLWE